MHEYVGSHGTEHRRHGELHGVRHQELHQSNRKRHLNLLERTLWGSRAGLRTLWVRSLGLGRGSIMMEMILMMLRKRVRLKVTGGMFRWKLWSVKYRLLFGQGIRLS